MREEYREISVWYNPKTNELGLFDWFFLETKQKRLTARLVLIKIGTNTLWEYIGTL